MGAYTAVADASETLVELLRGQMRDLVVESDVALTSPGATGTDGTPRLTLFLYRTEVNPYLRNRDHAGTADSRPKPGSLALDLHYLLTAHPSDGGSDETARSLEQQRVLGRAVQVLADNSVVTGSNLRASLADDRELRVVFDSQSTNDAFEVWNTFTDVPFQPSVVCVVGPVFVESETAPEAQRVVSQQVDKHLLEGRDADE
ncbi:hypothetical protein C474_06902 [Halogeometricum pallidum JCM 14848]|uniref:Pvc16 N-terminal domain-containing protein n=1 Tax=Halogeometricum pallidum JCM 14848 TaxID=1227487 RepID=M0DCL6_HALPD|nr:DUF4255 domain-containing protein [Halogeometricum pallidum]ELZ32528.1 hypothetical protein C474_06902 [Halogeometricum pallidum JCM 14848]